MIPFSAAPPSGWRIIALRGLLALCAVLAAGIASRTGAQSAVTRPDNRPAAARCNELVAERLGPDKYPGPSVPLHELLMRSAPALSACQQATLEQPGNQRWYAHLARIRALSGDGKGALEAARKGAARGSASAQVMLGVTLADGELVLRDYAAARELFLAAAKAGHPLANFNLAVMWANGWGTAADRGDAIRLFNQAAQDGDALAMQIRGQMEGGSQQRDAWWKKAAETMDPEGPRNPLRIARLGVAAPPGAELLRWYERQAGAGQTWAQTYLGALYEAGQWATQDYALAAQWYRRAGAAGNPQAQTRLARLYRLGLGVPQDEKEAQRWAGMWRVQACEAQAAAEPELGECDRLAADRYDPDRVAQGMADPFCLQRVADRAVAACTRALAQAPGVVRLRAQRARAFAHLGRFEEARKDALAAAAKGSTASMILLGVMSQRGLGLAKDEARALDWYRKAAELGNQRAVYLVLFSAETGIGVARDSPEAQALLEQMRNRLDVTASSTPSLQARAEQGDPRAEHGLAARFEQEKNYEQAIKWYERAAAHGSEVSALNLAQMYEKGIGVKQDSAEAKKRYRALVEKGDGEARYRLAALAERDANYAQAIDLYQRAVERDDYRAMLSLGEMSEQGRGVKPDVRRAAALYERAADHSPWARFKLGALYLDNQELRDYAKAQFWLEKSAADGKAGARNNLGYMAEHGLAGKRDYQKAAQAYFDAHSAGSLEARGNLENLYEQGLGAPADDTEALGWWRRGAEAGITAARYRLGMAYAQGKGVRRDETEALKWLDQAARAGHARAREEAGNLHYARGEYQAAAEFGNPRAIDRLVEQGVARGASRAEIEGSRALLSSARSQPAPVWPQSISRDPGEDQRRTIQVRAMGSGEAHAAAQDAGLANIYTVIPWWPAIDAKAAAK